MAIGELFNTLTFGGVNSGDYGIYISGEGVFNAPARAVEMISVPGRNGDISLDLGRYENITVTYPAGVFGDDNVDFREKLSDFRNAILSQKGYQRLEDTYHPDEFRFGLYASGLEVAPVKYNEAGQFELAFNCKPQRFLVEGDSAITVSDGDTLTNPTLFDSSPLIEIGGPSSSLTNYLRFNNYEIEINDEPIGTIELLPERTASPSLVSDDVNLGLLNYGDNVQIERLEFNFVLHALGESVFRDFRITTQIRSSNFPNQNYNFRRMSFSETDIAARVSFSAQPFQNTRRTQQVFEETIRLEIPEIVGSTEVTAEIDITFKFSFNNRTTPGLIQVSFSGSNTGGLYNVGLIRKSSTRGAVVADSTQSYLGSGAILDLETGLAYRYVDNELFGLNKWISFGSDLPVLAPGNNEVRVINIQTAKFTPRWWKL